jgi:hypothetical protein
MALKIKRYKRKVILALRLCHIKYLFTNVVQKLLKQAAETTAKVMSNFLIPAVETVIDEGTQVTIYVSLPLVHYSLPLLILF